MNRQILDPLRSIGIPEKIDEFFDDFEFSAISFNKWGTILAAGCLDGLVTLFDFQARSLGMKLHGHKSMIVCICWSKNGHYLTTLSADNHIIQWDIREGTQRFERRITDQPRLISIDVHPLTPEKCIINFGTSDSLIIDISNEKEESQTLPSLNFNANIVNQPQPQPQPNHADVDENQIAQANNDETVPNDKVKNEGQENQKSDAYVSLAMYGKNGDLIYAVQPKGVVLVVCSTIHIVFDVIRLSQNGPNIQEITQNHRGSYLVVNASDRIIRLYKCVSKKEILDMKNMGHTQAFLQDCISKNQQIPSVDSVLWNLQYSCLKKEKEFQNVIDRTPWFGVQFNVDDEYIASGVDSKTDHLVYIWNRPFGKLEQILEGPKEGLGGMLWHPLRSILLTISKTKRKIYIWDKQYKENWSAFAPGFEELEENREYVEKETEFDINSNEDTDMAQQQNNQYIQNGPNEQQPTQQNGKDINNQKSELMESGMQPEDVDVEGFENIKCFSSDDESQDTKYLPVICEEDEEEVLSDKIITRRSKY